MQVHETFINASVSATQPMAVTNATAGNIIHCTLGEHFNQSRLQFTPFKGQVVTSEYNEEGCTIQSYDADKISIPNHYAS